MKYELYCFRNSGFSYKVALLLHLLELPWIAHTVQYKRGETKTDKFRAELNIAGECPVLCLDDNKKLYQSATIMIFLSELKQKYIGYDEWEKYEIYRWLFFDNHKFSSNLATHRYDFFIEPGILDCSQRALINQRMKNAFDIAEQQLSKRAYIAGTKELSIADLSIAGYLLYPSEEIQIDIENDYPSLFRIVNEIKALPNWRSPDKLLPSEIDL